MPIMLLGVIVHDVPKLVASFPASSVHQKCNMYEYSIVFSLLEVLMIIFSGGFTPTLGIFLLFLVFPCMIRNSLLLASK
jgi:hypothetical protein